MDKTKTIQKRMKINRLTVITEPYNMRINGRLKLVANCQCECGNIRECVVLYLLQRGEIKECRDCAKAKRDKAMRKLCTATFHRKQMGV